VQVNQDSLSFWVAVTLKDTVSLDHRIQLNCNRIKTTKGNLKISEKGSKPLRVGVAVRQKGQDGVFRHVFRDWLPAIKELVSHF
jgi:sialidase-1